MNSVYIFLEEKPSSPKIADLSSQLTLLSHPIIAFHRETRKLKTPNSMWGGNESGKDFLALH
jgi:hypothetical protein